MNNFTKEIKYISFLLALLLMSNYANAFTVTCHEEEVVSGDYYDVGHSAFVTEQESNTYGYVGLDATLYWSDQFGPNSQYYGPWGSPYLPNVQEVGFSGGAGIDFEGQWEFASEWRGRAVLANFAGQPIWSTLIDCSAYYG